MATGDLIPGNKCGRQPENVISLEDCSILERPGSPVVAELQPASTKGRNFEEQMEVVNKRRRNMINVGTPSGSNGVSNGRSVGGSRHAVLTNEEEIDAGGDVGESREAQTNNNLGASSLRHMREEGSLALAKYGMDLRNARSSENGGQGKHPTVAVQGVLLYGNTELNPAKHTMIEMGEVERTPITRSAKCRVLPLLIKGGTPLGSVKKGARLPTTQKVSLKPKKKDDRGASRSTLAASLSPLIAELHSAVNDGNGERGKEHTCHTPKNNKLEVLEGVIMGLGEGVGMSSVIDTRWHEHYFWYDSWLGCENRLVSECLLETAPRPLTVADMVTNTEQIVAELPPNRDVDSDITSWRLEDRQTFIMKSAYDHLRASSDNNRCELYSDALEDITHVLRDCIVARDLWVKVLPLAHLNSFFQLHADEWLRVNLFAPAGFLIVLMEWPRKFAILCSLLWKNRCCRVMGSECLHREELLVRGTRLLEECLSSFHDRRDVVTRGLLERWKCPALGWVKVNVDAAVNISDRLAVIGGVIRDGSGGSLFGYFRVIGRSSALVAELWAIHDALAELGRRVFATLKLNLIA
ncbi:hypothetical protein V6N11_068085 [Hibiscus sabdariffa]|uniref:RNase H type-1 domain-containing protein n=1 Tax=Hibiscus sabdariffa TaxID=183260 RepID=A0ABR2SSQ0_9ROSI